MHGSDVGTLQRYLTRVGHDTDVDGEFGRGTRSSVKAVEGDEGRRRNGGRGAWITIRANSGHAYMMVAGLRFDTSGLSDRGTRWSRKMRSARGFKGRHPSGF